MKLNISSEKLVRLLLTVNPTLARYKGSVAAIRILLNTLGIKCITLTNKQSISMKYVISGLPENFSTIDVANMLFAISYQYGKYIKPFKQETLLSAINEQTQHVNGFTSDVKVKDRSSSEIDLIPMTDELISRWNSDVHIHTGDRIITDISSSERVVYTVKAQTEIINLVNKYASNYFANAKMTLVNATPITVSNSAEADTSIVILLTNISDKNAEPIKSILAKQLQEILPINVAVLPDNIIGCAADE